MRFRLTPKEDGFSVLFTQQAAKLVEGAQQLTVILEAATQDERRACAEALDRIESAADNVTHEIINKVNSSFITPFDRDDIHGLAVAIDDCLDHMDAAADLIFLYQVDEFPKRVFKQVEVLNDMAALTLEAMPKLRTMKDLQAYWIEINRLESQADKQYRRMLADIFNDEDANPITVMKLKEIINELEASADAFEKVANMVEGIAVKES
jgi:predicted phosphate transport protein (TIGR00153 family)